MKPFPVTGLILALCSVAPHAAEAQRTPGERLYLEGIAADGEALEVRVAADVRADGRLFACVNCHQRSGLGTVEGAVIAWPIAGDKLLQPRRRTNAWNPALQSRAPGTPERWKLPVQHDAADARPAYDLAAFTRLLRDGVDPAGREVGRAMPRYRIGDEDAAQLFAYLQSISTRPDPGIDEQTIRFATIVDEAVEPRDREAMLGVLQNYIDVHNTQTRPHERRAEAGPYYKTEAYGAYRRFALDIWTLRGDPAGWPQQLERYYAEQPVFAILGGIAAGDWAPIHDFSETHRIPTILPVTDAPVISERDWYTLYFSRGHYQEGQTAARYLRRQAADNGDLHVLQIYRAGSPGARIARGLRESLSTVKSVDVDELVLGSGEALTTAGIDSELQKTAADMLLLWLDAAELESPSGIFADQRPPILLSASLLQERFELVPAEFRRQVYFTYPYDLPQDRALKEKVLLRWLNARKIPVSNLPVQARMYFLGWMLNGAVANMRSEFYRDYFMESFDSMHDQDYAIAVYPRLTFGQGQRYSAKGGYVVQVDADDATRLTAKIGWTAY